MRLIPTAPLHPLTPYYIPLQVMQLILLLIALTQTMVIHRLEHYQMSDVVIIADKVLRIMILTAPCIPYYPPCYTPGTSPGASPSTSPTTSPTTPPYRSSAS